MAQVFKDPVIVPRREDAPYWLGVPSGSEILINLTQQKEFAASGQVPTKFWRWDFDSDTRSWNAAPVANSSLLHITPFAKLWRWDWDSDTRTFNWPPQASDVLVNLTQQVQYGQGGQIPTLIWFHGLDGDIHQWNWLGQVPFIPNISVTAATPFSISWQSNLDTDTREWNWSGLQVNQPLVLASPFFKFWRYDLDSDPYQWNWAGSQVNQPLVLASPFFKFWHYDLDGDTRQWNWSGDSLFIPNVPATVATAFHQLWRYDYIPDPSWTWSGVGQPAVEQLTQLYAPITTLYTFEHDSGATQWTWTAPGSNTLSMLTEGGMPFHKFWFGMP